MKIGFRIPYQKCDATYAALQVAKIATDLGLSVEIMPKDRATPVLPAFDRLVLRNTKLSYDEWLKTGFSHIVFTDAPSAAEVDAAREAKIKTLLIVVWDVLGEEDAKTLPLFNNVVCPAQCVQKLLKYKLNLKNISHVQWDPGIPITHDPRRVQQGKVAVLWSIENCQSIRQEPTILPVIEDFLRQCPEVWLTVTYSGIVPQGSVRELRRMATSAAGRVELLKNVSWDRQQLLYGSHDLTVWPSVAEGVGLTGLCSVYMGTPVLAFDHPVIGEFINEGKNGILVPCDLKYNWLEVPYVDPDYFKFGELLSRTVRQVDYLTELRESVTNGLNRRRRNFQSFWKGMFV
jgi:hypothetical protein